MANMDIKLDLLKFHSVETQMKGKAGTPVMGVFIPYEPNFVYIGEKGRYLALTAVELQNPKYEDTHMVKIKVDKAVREAMSEEQRKAIPIVGNARYYGKSGVTAGVVPESTPEVFVPENYQAENPDLPF